MPSTVIKRFEYRPDTRELMITFVTGRRYLYREVPEAEAQRFRSAFAKGVHFNRHISHHFPCEEVK
ncbi:MAG TPA: KTSC domain-containing protein [Sphingomicrobium sp.]|nr:KTSC domain-containing protein [Sphingomicrobium sp.]